MRIAFDAQPLLSDVKSGVGYHEQELVKGLIKEYPENEYLFEFFSWKNASEKQKILMAYQTENADHTKLAGCRWFPGSLYRMASAFLPLPYVFFFPKKREITHFFNYYIPPFVRGKKVVTIHDMAFCVYPETVRKKTRIFLKLVLKRSIRRADKIITVSKFSKQEILRFYPVPKEKIAVIPNGVDFRRFHPDYKAEQVQQVKEKYQISSREYFLFLGNLEPRKNLVRLIQAYKKFLENAQTKMPQVNKAEIPSLVIAGGKGWMYTEIFSNVQKEKLEDSVIFPGYIAEEEVPVLIAGACLFCFPSLYEGFGMPVLEAMACGTPVLTSNTSALKEIVKDAGLCVNPLSVEAMAEGMEKIYCDKSLFYSYQQKGLERAKEFSWKKAVDKLIYIYKEM